MLKIQLFTDSETIFNGIIINSSTTEKRLMIDVKAAREDYIYGTLDDVIWIRIKFNLTEAMTKASIMP